jgi:hypothetical protein
MNRYKVLLPLEVHTADAAYKQGEEFDAEFTAEEEATNLGSGLLEIVPRTYKVVGGSDVFETPTGGTVDAALTIPIEAMLVGGGHIERVDPPAAPTHKPRVPKEK